MATLSITKSYADGVDLTESQLDDIKTSVENFINVTKINDDNLQTGGVGSASIATSAITTAKIGSNAVTKAKIATDQQNPAGMIAAYSGESAPTGWLVCDGSAVSRTTYADLFAAIASSGVAYGEGDGSTTFNVPDLRGRFLRGWDNTASNDPDSGSRTAMNTGGATGDNIGSIQADATATPNTAFTTDDPGTHTHTVPMQINSGTGASLRATAHNNTGSSSQSTSGADGAHTHSITGGGDNETRPLNANVNYIIKT